MITETAKYALPTDQSRVTAAPSTSHIGIVGIARGNSLSSLLPQRPY
ncbi:MAG: hypothetical protein OXC95_13960 [Dehalococcoidia bacterium]|nr:hypothetical protein [Dehalococcoidia bacterium]